MKTAKCSLGRHITFSLYAFDENTADNSFNSFQGDPVHSESHNQLINSSSVNLFILVLLVS